MVKRRSAVPTGGDPLIIGHLMACAPRESRKATAGSIALSLLGHGALLALAVWLTSMPADGTKPPPRILDIQLPPERATPELPPPPPPAHVQPPQTALSGRTGFPTLEAPTVTPPDIPPIRPGAFTDERLYTGIGAPDGAPPGSAPARSVSPDDPDAAPAFVPLTVAPELKNRGDVARAAVRLYPGMLRDAGIAGRVLVWVYVDQGGKVLKAQVKESSGYPQLDQAALEVARLMVFTPGMNRDQAVPCWIALPIQFQVGGR